MFIRSYQPFNSNLLITCFLTVVSLCAQAQAPHLEVSASRSKIVLGDTLTLRLSSQFKPDLQQDLSSIRGDTLGIFEIINRSQPTTATKNNLQHFEQTLTLIAFDAGQYQIPSFKINYTNQPNNTTQTIATQAIDIQIDSIPVAIQQDIKPIKPIIEVPYTWHDYLPYIIGLMLAILISNWLYKRLKTNRTPKQNTTAQSTTLSPDQVAWQQLQALIQARYWQQGETKRYYSELSDIIRQYIADRYQLNAKEQTTDEILDELHKIGTIDPKLHTNTSQYATNINENTPTDLNSNSTASDIDTAMPSITAIEPTDKPLNNDQLQTIKTILETADMVKFAKANPSIDTNSQMIDKALQWIRTTKK